MKPEKGRAARLRAVYSADVLAELRAKLESVEAELKELNAPQEKGEGSEGGKGDPVTRFGHWSSSPVLQQLCPSLSKFVRAQYSEYRDTQVSLREVQVHLDMEKKEKTVLMKF